MTTTPTVYHRPTVAPPGYRDRRAEHLRRLRHAEEQVRRIARMVAEDRYRVDVVTEISDAIRALQQVALDLLDDHLRYCLITVGRVSPAASEARLLELSATLRRTPRR